MAPAPHPLDPLTAEEIGLAAAILRRDQAVSERWRFASIELREPSKQVVGAFGAGDQIRREAVVICWNRDDGEVYKAVVALGEDRVLAWEQQPDGQPNMTVDEFHECDATLRRDQRVIDAPAERGITDRLLPPHRLRRRRVGPGVHDHVARARLRLPRRDRLPRRGDARHPRRALPDPERDLHPRGGRRRPLEARRRQVGAEVRRSRRLVLSFHLTVANYEYLVYWRIWPDDLLPTVARIVQLPGVRLVGLGTNLTCFGAVLPSEKNMGELAGYAAAVEAEFGVAMTYVSAGNSSSLPFLLEGRLPPGVNNLRIGESILQGGRDTFFDQPWAELDRNAFLLEGELLEVKVKPSVPIGDTDVETAGVEVLGASSDHLIVDVTDMSPPPQVGDVLPFHMGYAALLAAMTSEYVEKQLRFEKPLSRRERIYLSVEPGLKSVVDDLNLTSRFAALGLAVAESHDDAIRLRLASNHLQTADLLSEVAAAHDAAGLIWLDAGASVMAPDGPVVTRGSLSPENVVLVGTRCVTPEEAAEIRGTAVSTFTIVEIDALSMAEVMRRAVRTAMNGTRGFIVSYHTSVTDIPDRPEGASGLSPRETHQAMEAIAQAPGLLALNVVGLDATADSSANALVCDFIMSCLGQTIL